MTMTPEELIEKVEGAAKGLFGVLMKPKGDWESDRAELLKGLEKVLLLLVREGDCQQLRTKLDLHLQRRIFRIERALGIEIEEDETSGEG